MKGIFEFIEYIKSKEIVDILIAIGVFVGFIILSSIFAKIIMRCFKIKTTKKSNKKNKIYKILKFIWIISGTYISLLILDLPENFMSAITKIFKLIIIYGLTRFFANLIDPNSKLLNKIKDSDSNNINEHTMNLCVKFLRGIIYIIGAFIFIAELGYDLSGLITGLGIGSVVLALAAQDLAKNLLGGLAIISDKTFVIGDTIEVSDIYGTVEDITFRTTKIRKLDNTVVTVPNSILSDSNIINWDKINKRRYECDLKVSLQMSQKRINEVMKKLNTDLQKNKHIIKDSVRVYFSDIQKDGYNIKIYLYTDITDYDNYIELISNINSQILDLLEHENVKLIYPTIQVER